MDRALQERVIGAIVLVVVAVLIVPVFLDGPSDDSEVVTEIVTLPGQNARQPETQKIVLSRDRTVPVPATTTSTIANYSQKPCRVVEAIAEAMEFAERRTADHDLILVTGSFYLVGPALDWLQQNGHSGVRTQAELSR